MDTEINPLDAWYKKQAEAGANGTSEDLSLGSTSNEAAARNQGLDITNLQLGKRAIRSDNYIAGAIQWAERQGNMPDPDFNLNDHWEELSQGVPLEYQDQFDSVRSLGEGKALRADILQELQDGRLIAGAGTRGMVASGLAGIIDADLPLTLLTDGSYTATKVGAGFAKAGLAGSKIEKVARTAAAGAEANAIVTTVGAVTRPTGTWEDVPSAVLGGAVFGATLGTVLPRTAPELARRALNKTRDEFQAVRTEGFPLRPDERPVAKMHPEDAALAEDPNMVTMEVKIKGQDSTASQNIDEDFSDEAFDMPEMKNPTEDNKKAMKAAIGRGDLVIRWVSPEGLLRLSPQRYTRKDSLDKIESLRASGTKFSSIPMINSVVTLGDGLTASSIDGYHRASSLVGKRELMPVWVEKVNGKIPDELYDSYAVPLRQNADDFFANKPPNIHGKKVKLVDVPKRKVATEDSVGAASLRADSLDPEMKPDTTALLGEVRTRMGREGLTGENWDTDSYFNKNAVSQAAKWLYKVISKTPWASDFDRLFMGDSTIGKFLGSQIFESPSGVGQQVNRTAAILQPQYNTAIAAPVLPHFKRHFKQWLKEKKSSDPDLVALNKIMLIRAFHREVELEMSYRYHDGVSNPHSSPAIRAFADLRDKASANAVLVQKGGEGERSVFGSENLEPTSGWSRQIWSGQSILNAIKRLEKEFGIRDGKDAIHRTMARSYRKLHGWSKKDADVVASAVLSRAIAHADGAHTNLFRLVTPEDADYLRQMLRDNGHSEDFAAKFMERIKGSRAERGKLASLKTRNDIDMREQIEGTSLQLVDLLDLDFNKTWSQYSRAVAGTAALARNGIHFHELMSRWIPAIKDEIAARGGKELPQGFYDAIPSYFSGKGYAGGLNPWVRRAMSLTNLSFLNSLGLTQMGEVGATIGALHLDNVIHSMPKELRYIFNGKLSPVHEDLKYIDSSIIGDHNIYQPHLLQNETRMEDGVRNELANFLDRSLAKGAHIQGLASGFYKINQAMQRMAGGALIRRLWKISIGKDKGFSDLRARSLGFLDPKVQERIMEYFRNGTVEIRDGNVYSLNSHKWNTSDWNEFSAIINRNSAQVVQRGLRGEDAWWMHKDAGAFMMHLKSFTFTAMHKQLIRNARIADAESLATLLYGLGTAAAAYTARQYTSGNQDKMTGTKLIKGMLNYSNMTAPIIQFSDPAFSMLGMDSMTVGHYGNGHGGNTSLISMPPSFNAIDRIGHIPKAAVKTAAGTYTKDDVYALQALPILGNFYGMGYIAHAMRDDIDERKRKLKQEKSKTTPATQVPVVPKEPKTTQPTNSKDELFIERLQHTEADSAKVKKARLEGKSSTEIINMLQDY